MDFGRLESVDGVRFELPAFDSRTDALLADGATGERARPQIRIGAPAWSSRDFAKKVYPKGTKAGDYLARYAERFWTVELNATFHRLPDVRTVEGWRDATPEMFRFCPKLHRQVTEKLDPDLGRRFADVVGHFGPRLGPMLLQLAPSFAPKRLADLDAFLRALEGRAVAVELRNRAWFEHGRLGDEVFALLAERGATAVITDTAGRRDVCHGSLTSRIAFVRFQGNQLHPSDSARLDAWTARFAAWVQRGVESIYLFVHQPEDTLTPETLALLAERVHATCDLPALPPAPSKSETKSAPAASS